MALKYLAVAAVVTSILFQLTPNVLDPTLWANPTPLRFLDGVLAPNTILDGTKFQHENIYLAPESVVFNNENGIAYASLSDGRVVAFTESGAFIRTQFFVGGYISGRNSSAEEQLQDFCFREAKAKRLAWNTNDERLCGRPLGLRLKKKNGQSILYVTDAYHGIFAINLKSNRVEHVVKPDSPIDAGTVVDSSALLPPKFFNDLDVKSDGSIIFTDSSYKFTRSENRKELLDAGPRARLMEYNPHSKTLTTLLCGLHFANGVQLLSDDSALVVESTRFRILKVDLNSPQLGSNKFLGSCGEYGSLWTALNSSQPVHGPVSIFFDSAPGFMDNIRLNTYGDPSLFVGVGSKGTKPFSLLWFAYQTIFLRNVVGKFVPMRFVEHLVPRYGLVIELDLFGNLKKSYHAPTGRVAFVSEAQRHPKTGDMWLGSHSNPFIAILPAKELS